MGYQLFSSFEAGLPAGGVPLKVYHPGWPVGHPVCAHTDGYVTYFNQ